MNEEEFAKRWQELSEEVVMGMKEWRLQHPQATLREIEAALDERLGRLRARMLQDAALASAKADWEGGADGPLCPECGSRLEPRVKTERHLQTHGGQEIVLERRYGVCPACGAGIFPMRESASVHLALWFLGKGRRRAKSGWKNACTP
jgi:YgiT-type zinc finger domain-containing protein